MKALIVRDLEKTFLDGFWRTKKKVLKKVSFQVAAGQTTGFVGVNGSGKTTSLKCILNFIFPEQGEILFFDNQTIGPKVKSQIGYLPERPYYYDFLTAEEFLKFHWRLAGKGQGFHLACRQILEKVNLLQARHKKLKSFSKGMLQRVGMAQAILHQPQFLILDEPMSGLDPDGRLIIKEIIREEQKRGTTIFFSSHLLGDMEELCQDLVIIHQGQVKYEGSMNQFILKSNIDYRITYVPTEKWDPLEIIVGKEKLQGEIDRLRQGQNQILKITPAQLEIEKAFSQLISADRSTPETQI